MNRTDYGRTFEPDESRIGDNISGGKTDVIYPPSLPSNLDKDRCFPAKFNSNGFYTDIQNRLDSQIRALQSVYNRTVDKIDQMSFEKNQFYEVDNIQAEQ